MGKNAAGLFKQTMVFKYQRENIHYGVVKLGVHKLLLIFTFACIFAKRQNSVKNIRRCN